MPTLDALEARLQAPPHTLDADAVAAALGVDPAPGLNTDEARRRLAAVGPNQLAEPARRPAWLALLDQFRNALIVILLVAAVVSLLVARDLKTPIVIAVVVLLNAVIGYVQEHRAEQRAG